MKTKLIFRKSVVAVGTRMVGPDYVPVDGDKLVAGRFVTRTIEASEGEQVGVSGRVKSKGEMSFCTGTNFLFSVPSDAVVSMAV